MFRRVCGWFVFALTTIPTQHMYLHAQDISADSLLHVAAGRYHASPDSAILFLRAALGQYPAAADQLRIRQEIVQRERKASTEFETFHKLAKLHLELGEPARASLFGDSAQAIAMKERNLVNLREIFQTRHLISLKAGEPHKALAFYRFFSRYRDSILRIGYERDLSNARRELAEARQTAVVQQEEAQAKVMEVRKERDRQWQYFLYMLGGFVILVFLLLLYRSRARARAAKLIIEKDHKLLELTSLRDRMFTVIAQDLRGPLSTYNNLTRSLAENLGNLSKQDVDGYLRNMHASSVELSRLFNNLLEWALVQTGSMPFSREVFSCKLIAMEVAEHVRPAALEKKLDLEFLIPDAQHAYADRTMIAIVLRNLLSNAIKFSPPGRSITVFSGRKQDLITLGVKDHGIGMKSDELQRILSSEQSAGGTAPSLPRGSGIGLQLCKELISKNGGNFYAESTPNEGSTFYFSLPENQLPLRI